MSKLTALLALCLALVACSGNTRDKKNGDTHNQPFQDTTPQPFYTPGTPMLE